MKNLREKGNTVLVIEHNTDVMRKADYVIEIGTKADRFGGELIGAGTLEDLESNEQSHIQNYLANRRQPKQNVRQAGDTPIQLQNAIRHNIASVSVASPT